jgi:hypothetical protein
MESMPMQMLENGHLSDEASAVLVEALRHRKKMDMPEDVLNHVETCGECKEKIIDVVTFLRHPHAAPVTVTPVKTRIRRRWYFNKVAAVFAGFALLISVYFFVIKNPSFFSRTTSDSVDGNRQEEVIQSETTDSTGITSSKEERAVRPRANGRVPAAAAHADGSQGQKMTAQLPTLRYQVNPNLENMIGSRLRSGLFEALTPQNNSVLTIPIQFSWKNEFLTLHTLKIVNNMNDLLYQYAVKGKSFEFRGNLQPGLYYWKIESQNELLYVGKFFIGNPPL